MKRLKLIGMLVIVLALGILILQNRAPVEVRFLLFSIRMPQVLLLMLIAAGGMVLGMLMALTGWPRRRKS